MRTPWRFVADLVSRKPKPDSHDEGPTVAPKAIALEYKPSPEVDQPSDDETAVDRSAESGSNAQVETILLEPDVVSTAIETEAPVAAEAPAAAADSEEPAAVLAPQEPEEKPSAPMSAEAKETVVKPATARRRKINPTVEAVVSATQTEEVAPAGPKSFMDEMADLDAEVDALRRQLARKLIEQNAQLRKMVARFDAR